MQRDGANHQKLAERVALDCRAVEEALGLARLAEAEKLLLG